MILPSCFKFHENFVLLTCTLWWLNHYEILHMARKLYCRNLWKMLSAYNTRQWSYTDTNFRSNLNYNGKPFENQAPGHLEGKVTGGLPSKEASYAECWCFLWRGSECTVRNIMVKIVLPRCLFESVYKGPPCLKEFYKSHIIKLLENTRSRNCHFLTRMTRWNFE